MNRTDAITFIKGNINCTEFLQPARRNYNEKQKTGYCCPICGSGTHEKGTGAVKVYTRSNTWHCHACDNGGDVIDLYRATTGADFNTALQELADRAGITIEQAQPAETAQNDGHPAEPINAARIDAQSRTEAPADYSRYYAICRDRITDPAAVSYLQARGISTAIAAACGIGFDPAADPATAPGATGDEYKAHPAARIIIPCSNSHYVARSIDPDTPPQYKALNPNTQKGGGSVSLFNQAAIYSGAPVVFVTEGVFDALSFLEAGCAAVALNSKGNNKLLLQLLEDKPTQAAFIICHDNDSNPNTAADTMRRANELNDALQQQGFKSIIYNIAGENHDANDALQADRSIFEQSIQAAIKELRRDGLTDFLEKIQTDAYKPHKTGLNFFDELIGGGIISQSLLLLMAAPGTGKTTLAQQIAETIAERQQPVVYFNFEMSNEQMLAKAISAKLHRSGTDKTALQILQGYSWTDDDRAAIERAIQDYRAENYPYMQYTPKGASSELSELLEFLQITGEKAKAAGQPAPAAIIDYLHLIKSSDGLETQELIKQAVTGLKQYAVRYNTFVIGIVATNRASNKGGRITMESGRDSSNLEYTADYQLSLNYLKIDNGTIDTSDLEGIAELQEQPRREMILRVLKNRFAQPGKSAVVMFDAAHNIFYGTAPQPENYRPKPTLTM